MGYSGLKRILFIDFCNYEDYQIGGHLSWAKNMLAAFGDQLALVGITTDKMESTGKWIKKTINGVTYDYFALARYDKSKTKRLIPDRIISYLLLRFFRKRILTIGIPNVFIQRHEVLPAIMNFGYENICYRFPGLESPLSISKYWFSKYFSERFDRIFFRSLSRVKLILASGDDEAIKEMIIKSNGIVNESSVIKFPTRINTDIYKPLDRLTARSSLYIGNNEIIIVTTGRLAQLKGWTFMIDCFELFLTKKSHSKLYFIGEGEDRYRILDSICNKGLGGKVFLTGEKNQNEIALFLNASDLFIMGSYKEGWSTSLSEAIACGVPACVTNFSSAKSIVTNGANGYVTDEHNKEIFVKNMLKALDLPRPVDNGKISEYSTEKLKEDLLKYWTLK